MPSTGTQKAKERRFRQLDLMLDEGHIDIMLGSYSRDDERDDRIDVELNLDSRSSRPQQNSNPIREDFGSLLNTNSRENSEITIETTRSISEEVTNQVARKLDYIRISSNTEIQNAISDAIAEKILPSIQNTLSSQKKGIYSKMDRRSSE